MYLHLGIWVCTHLYMCLHTYIYKNSSWTHMGNYNNSSIGLVLRNLQPTVLFLTGNTILLGEYRTSPNSNPDRIWNYDTVEPSRNSLLKKLGPKCWGLLLFWVDNLFLALIIFPHAWVACELHNNHSHSFVINAQSNRIPLATGN